VNPPPGHRGSDSPVFLFFLVVTSVLCGGLVMVIEVLGSKVVGPFFGVSLFVWTSLITVTLVALALAMPRAACRTGRATRQFTESSWSPGSWFF
jgi:hypothetical protein